MDDKKLTVWISKYALSGGIQRAEVERSRDDGNRVYRMPHFQGFDLGRDAHLTEVEAVKAAERARVARIVSLKKQIAKLEKLSFTPKQ